MMVRSDELLFVRISALRLVDACDQIGEVVALAQSIDPSETVAQHRQLALGQKTDSDDTTGLIHLFLHGDTQSYSYT